MHARSKETAVDALEDTGFYDRSHNCVHAGAVASRCQDSDLHRAFAVNIFLEWSLVIFTMRRLRKADWTASSDCKAYIKMLGAKCTWVGFSQSSCGLACDVDGLGFARRFLVSTVCNE